MLEGKTEVAKSFDDVELTVSEISEQPVTTEEKKQDEVKPEVKTTESGTDTEVKPVQSEADKPTETKPETEPEPKIKVGEREYTADELQQALEDSENKKKWSTTNTQEAQEIAEKRKAIEPVIQLMTKLKGNKEVSEEVKNALIETFGEDFQKTIDEAFNYDSTKHANPFKTELEELQKKHDELQGQIAVRESLDALADKYKLNKSKTKEIHDAWLKKYEETGEVMEFEDIYKLIDYENQKKKAEEKKPPTPPNPPDKTKGATDIKSIEDKPKSFDDIDISEVFINTT